jgi:hypothetical protein
MIECPFRRDLIQCAFLLGALAAAHPPLQGADQAAPKPTGPAKRAALAPQPDGNSFCFQTDAIEGTLRTDSVYHGLTRLVDRRTGRQVIDERYSALNLFKLMSVNLVMGMPRTMERKVRADADAVEIAWPATDTHHGQITARYEVRTPAAVDLTVTIRARATYPGYELFLSSYFDKVLRPHVCLQPVRGHKSAEASPWVLPLVNDAFRGTVLVFPRDAHAARRCVDGRWDRLEAKIPTVQMCPVRRYAQCVAVMRDPQQALGVVLMSRPSDCYAISTRYHADDDQQRLTTYSAFDLSLFGDDLLPGVERTVRVRLALTPLDREFSQALELYRAFLAETP